MRLAIPFCVGLTVLGLGPSAFAGGVPTVVVQNPTAPPPLFDPRSEPITEGAMPMPMESERAEIMPRLQALRAYRHEVMLKDRHSDSARYELQSQAYLALAMLNANSCDGFLVMTTLGEAETTAGTLITLGDRARARELLNQVHTKINQLLSSKPQNPVLRFLERSAAMKLGLVQGGQGGPMPPSAGGDPTEPPPPEHPMN